MAQIRKLLAPISILTVSLAITQPADAGLEGLCPDTAAEALKLIDVHVEKGNWVNIDIKSCHKIQSEITKSARRHIATGDIKKLIPLMSADTMRLVRNTPYAMHGYSFNSQDLKTHFSNFPWYNPVTTNASKIKLNQAETEFVDLLKPIEQSWTKFCKGCYTNVKFAQSKLPRQVKIEQNKIIFQNKTKLDISPRTQPNPANPYTNDHIYYKANGIDEWDSVLACEYVDVREQGVDLVATTKISLYSISGVLLNEIDTRSPEFRGNIFTDPCPTKIKSYSDILVSYADNSCCGGKHDVLITYDKNLNRKSQAEGLVLLLETLGREIYYVTIDYISERSEQRVMDGHTYSLWKLDKNGNSKLLTKKTTELLYKDEAFYSYGKNQHVNLYEQPKNFNNQYIAAAKTLGNSMILFWYDDKNRRPDGITIVPINPHGNTLAKY